MEKRIYELKILNDFADSILACDKTFEIRKNDRGFQKGDFIKFNAVDNFGTANQHLINNKLFLITYILNGWGLEKNFVVMSIKIYES